MDLLIASLLYFLRPILFIDHGLSVAGLRGYAISNLVYFVPLLFLGLKNLLEQPARRLSSIEKLLLLSIGWGMVVALLFSAKPSLDMFIKMVAPFVTFFILRRVVSSKEKFVVCLKALLAGFVVPVFASAYLISHRRGNISTDFFSGIERFSGVYSQIHPMGHSMGFVFIAITLLLVVVNSGIGGRKIKIGLPFYCYLVVLASGAAYCMLHAHVRTAYLGLLVFFALASWSAGKKYFLLLGVLGALVSVTQMEQIKLVFQDVIDAVEGRESIEKAGSGRLLIWGDKIDDFHQLPLEKKITGMGLGGQFATSQHGQTTITGNGEVFDSHNDFLQTVMEFGLVGLGLLMALYVSIWRAIGRMPEGERFVFRSFFIAVLVMNFVSNSYISRFGLSQLFFMLMIYVEQPWLRGRVHQPVKARQRWVPPLARVGGP